MEGSTLVSVTLRGLYHLPVVSPKGKSRGRVVDALFDNSRPVVVGYLVERPRLLMLFDRPERHLAADRVRVAPDGIRISAESDAWDKKAASRLALDWDLTVIWSGMPVRTADGAKLGVVRDASFDPKSGQLDKLVIGLGAVADAAVGVREIGGWLVQGFRDGHVVVEPEVAGVETDGGAAAIAGRGAAVAKVKVGEAAKAATDAGRTALQYGKAAARVAAQSETGKKAARWLKSVRNEIADAMKDEESGPK